MKNTELIPITIYCDSTGLFSEKECDTNNLTDMLFPVWIVEAWYKENEQNCIEECLEIGECLEEKVEPNFYNWYTSAYTATSTDGLYDFAVAKGYNPIFEIPDNTQNAVVYENLEYDTVVVFTGTTMECRKWARERDWKITIGHSDTEVDLKILFH